MKHLCIFLISVCLAGSLYPQSDRVALVIGNSNYNAGAPLANPVNDATDIEAGLKAAGFEVKKYIDLDQVTMKKVIDEFGTKMNSADIGLFFYAGHGLQSRGRNYLIPVDANLKTENDVEYNCVDAGRILAKMEDAGTVTNIVILDACRDNPFERSWSRKSTGAGLAFMDAPNGSFIAYSTEPGKTASDGYYRNSPYTEALTKYLNIPNLKIEDLFKLVRVKVREKTSGGQVPWESTSLVGDFYFNLDLNFVSTDAAIEEIDPGLSDKLMSLADASAGQRMSSFEETRKQLAAGIRSVAVLPFANYTGDVSKTYIALGMQDALITELGQFSSLRVMARTSTMQYSNFQKTINQVASELNVDGIIETSLIGIDEELRVQIKLYSAFPEEQLIWSQVYNSEMSDIFSLYNKVIKNIADEIQLSLTPEQETSLEESRKIDSDAYEAYLKGQYYFEQVSADSIQLALQYFELAIQKEPEWADPYVVLSQSWSVYGRLGLIPGSIARANKLRYLERAIELNPESAKVHYGKANHAVWTDWDWELGEKEYIKTLELNPNDALARLYYAHLLMILHRSDEAVHQANLGLALDPLRPLVLGLYGVVMEGEGNYQSAISAFEKARTIGTDFAFAAVNILPNLYKSGDYEEWIRTWEIKVRDVWNNTARESVVDAFYEKGHIAAVEEMFKMNEKYGNGPGNANMTNSLKARRSMYLGKPVEAIDYLERMFESDQNSLNITYIGTNLYFYDQLKKYPRYIDLLRKMKLPIE